MALQAISYAAQIAGGVNLKNPAESFTQFSERVSKTFGKTVNSSPAEFENPFNHTNANALLDPVLDIDWIGMVIDRSNPRALDWNYIKSIQTPSLDIEPRPVFRAGKMSHYAGVLSVSNIQLGLYTDRTGKAFKFASSWMASVYNNETGDYFLPKDYKKDVYVYMLDQQTSTVCLMKFFGCFPVSWTSYNLHGGSAAEMPTTMDLAVDSFSIGGGAQVSQQISALAAAGG